MSDTPPSGIAAYYDHLQRFLDFARRFNRGGGAEQNSVHRFLAALPGENETQTPGPERLDHLVMAAAQAAQLAPTPRMLDAGCGLGGTIFRWHARFGGTYDGLTLSPEQQRRATAEANRRTIADVCRFHVRSYLDPIPNASITGPFDAVVAIESLAHSPDPIATIANLVPALAPGGILLIVDDMPTDSAKPALLAGFKRGWQCPVLATRTDYHASFAVKGLRLVHDEDLSPRIRSRRLTWLRILIAGFGLARRIIPISAARDVIGAIQGGFYLEALYRTGGMQYRLMVAKRL